MLGGIILSRIIQHIQLLLILSLINCADTSDEYLAGNNSIKIKNIVLEKQTGDCEKNETENCATIKIDYIQIDYSENQLVQDSINAQIINELLQPIGIEKNNESFELMMQNFIDDYNNFKKEFPDSYQQWEYERKVTDRYIDKNILCCEFREYSYLGGAHPNSFLTFTNFNLNSAEIINLSDILIDSFLNELNNIAELIFRKEKELADDINLTEAGFWFDDDKFSVNNNFTIGKDGLTFFYNSYEITAYAYGPTELFIPYKSIKKLIKPNGLLASFTGD
ncbi:MAG: DUF4163 domain-containing protein [Bacteroidetes bacterium]|nr:DUF4163 domain-containing protein [Bacteroidota bacterium]